MNQYNLIGLKYIKARKIKESVKALKSRKFILSNLEFKNKTILDLGCGKGDDIKIYEDHGTKNVFGIDDSRIMVNEAKRMLTIHQR